jgi:hypothetical protein
MQATNVVGTRLATVEELIDADALVKSKKLSTDVRRALVQSSYDTAEAMAKEPSPFPGTTADRPIEIGFADWRHRLTANLSRRSDGRWDPLTEAHAAR